MFTWTMMGNVLLLAAVVCFAEGTQEAAPDAMPGRLQQDTLAALRGALGESVSPAEAAAAIAKTRTAIENAFKENIKQVDALAVQYKVPVPKQAVPAGSQATATTPAKATSTNALPDGITSVNWESGSQCGLNAAQRAEVIKATNCNDDVKKKGRANIKRMFGTPTAHGDAITSIQGFFDLMIFISRVFGWREDILPSETCCKTTPKKREFFGFTDRIVENCCGITPEAKCNVNDRKTCLPLLKIVLPRDKAKAGGWDPNKREYNLASNNLMCLPRMLPTLDPSLAKEFPSSERREESDTGLVMTLGDALHSQIKAKSSARWAKKLKKGAKSVSKGAKSVSKTVAKEVPTKSVTETVTKTVAQVPAKSVAKSVTKTVAATTKEVGKVATDATKAVTNVATGVLSGLEDQAMQLILKGIPKDLQPPAKTLITHAIKGKLKEGLVDALTKLVGVQYAEVIKNLVPAMIRFDINGMARVILQYWKVVAVPPLAVAVKMHPMVIECAVRRFVTPITDARYNIMVEHVKNATGEGCSDSQLGPLNMKVRRKFDGKTVCVFEYKWDMHACANRYNQCCRASNWNTPRSYSTNYKPSLQTKGHECKKWYIATSSVVSSLMGAAGTLANNLDLHNCLKEDCNAPELCNEARCNKGSFASKCRWNSKANPFGEGAKGTHCQSA